MYYYEVAPNYIVRTSSAAFTYSSETPLQIGHIVTISVGKKTAIGVVIRAVSKPIYETKAVESIIEEQPLPEELVSLALWMSDYYVTHLGVVLQTLLPRGLTTKRRTLSSKKVASPLRDRTHFLLNEQQKGAVETIRTSVGTVLLHRITGSGKTAVYIESAKRAIADGKSVILLVPEIALTAQLIDEFSHHFDDIILTHSKQTEAERHAAWKSALYSDTPRIAIGPRSALFLPLRNLGLILVDEAHEPAFKQEQSPRYSALRAASVLAKRYSAPVVLGSATPLVSDFFTATHANTPIISLPYSARENTVKPDIRLVDMTKRANFKKHRFISDPLLKQMHQTLESGKQVLLYHNRRGTTSTTLCTECGWAAVDPETFIPLTLHADQHVLRSHVTGQTWPVPTHCPECGSADIIHKGIGTKLIESEVQKIFPGKTIARFDADTTADDTVEKRYKELYDGQIDIIIGTQVIAKGLDLPHLRTVGVVQADSGLSLPDFSSPERTFQLLAQVVGRVGRSHHATTVIVQSYQPTHPSIVHGLHQAYEPFYQAALAERRRAQFPPFNYLLQLTCVYKSEAAAIKNAKKLATELRSHMAKEVTILGPTPAFYERAHGTYRWQLLVKSPKRQHLVDLLAHIPTSHWQYELDPMSLL